MTGCMHYPACSWFKALLAAIAELASLSFRAQAISVEGMYRAISTLNLDRDELALEEPMNHDNYDPAYITDILKTTKTVARTAPIILFNSNESMGPRS